jgi:hypothetical protein
MAQYFQLFDKNTGEAKRFLDVDEEICNHMGIKADDIKWAHQWYDIIGLFLSCGKNWDEIRIAVDGELKEIVDFMEDNYRAECWSGR